MFLLNDSSETRSILVCKWRGVRSMGECLALQMIISQNDMTDCFTSHSSLRSMASTLSWPMSPGDLLDCVSTNDKYSWVVFMNLHKTHNYRQAQRQDVIGQNQVPWPTHGTPPLWWNTMYGHKLWKAQLRSLLWMGPGRWNYDQGREWMTYMILEIVSSTPHS